MDFAILTIRVIPRAGRAGPAGTRDNAFLIRLHAPAVEGAANAELVERLARLFDVPKRNVSIVGGERSRLKRVRVMGITAENAVRILNQES
jgi:uncharacterized protein